MKRKLAISAGLLAAFGCFSCHRASTKPEAEISWGINGTNVEQITLAATNPLKEFTGAMTTRVDEFISSFTNAMPTNDIAARARVAAYTRTDLLSASTNSLPGLGAAAEFFLQLKKEGRLPGLPKESHGSVTTSLGLGGVQQYPFSLTFHVVATGDTSTNHYTLLRSSSDAPWQLEKAWRTDTQGLIIVEWPVK